MVIASTVKGAGHETCSRKQGCSSSPIFPPQPRPLITLGPIFTPRAGCTAWHARTHSPLSSWPLAGATILLRLSSPRHRPPPPLPLQTDTSGGLTLFVVAGTQGQIRDGGQSGVRSAAILVNDTVLLQCRVRGRVGGRVDLSSHHF